MDQQGSYDGFSPGVYGTPALYTPPVPHAVPPPPALRPLSTGEVLDRTFMLYRKRFWLFIAIGTLPAAVLTLSAIVRMIYTAVTHHSTTVMPGAAPNVLADGMSSMLMLQLYLLPVTIIFVLAYGLSHAAVVNAVGCITQGVAVSAQSAYRAVSPHWLRWTGIALRQFWTFVWPLLPAVLLLGISFAIARVRNNSVAAGLVLLFFGLLMVAGFVLGFINILRVALAVPAGVQENLGVGAAMRRSRDLVAGRKGRIFLALMLVYALQMVAGGIQVPLVLLAATTRGGQQIALQVVELAVQFITTALVSPIASIALCLFYIDERVRREGYDIELLMRRSFAGSINMQADNKDLYTSPASPPA